MVHSHRFSDVEVKALRSQLLQFYDKEKRILPWRTLAESPVADINKKAYGVWVSEIMLQQTQVSTVIDYYNRWIKKWPTVAELAEATLQEVNEMWAGLGYYSRGRRLLEGAQKIMKGSGLIPQTSKQLVQEIPGVGKYTAGAIASIAFKQVTGVVDGNVIRVLSRLRLVGVDSMLLAANELYWELANTIVDRNRPGDFNQAMMELGATVCTPKSPSCSKCPLRNICKAFGKSKYSSMKKQANLLQKSEIDTHEDDQYVLEDIEEVSGCKYCLNEDSPWDESLGVMNYPRKAKKKPPKEEKYIAVMVENEKSFLLTKRSTKGLLAGLLEFPLIQLDENGGKKTSLIPNEMKTRFLLENIKNLKHIGEVKHVFSHVHHTYDVYHCSVDQKISMNTDDGIWLTKEDILEKSAVSTAIKKIFRLFESVNKGGNQMKLSGKRKLQLTLPSNQKTLDSLFRKKTKVK